MKSVTFNCYVIAKVRSLIVVHFLEENKVTVMGQHCGICSPSEIIERKRKNRKDEKKIKKKKKSQREQNKRKRRKFFRRGNDLPGGGGGYDLQTKIFTSFN